MRAFRLSALRHSPAVTVVTAAATAFAASGPGGFSWG